MSADKFFLDTNILVYCFDDRDPEKKDIALALVARALESGDGMISWQVVQEFLNVATRKFEKPLRATDARLYLQRILTPLCQIYPDAGLYESALDMAKTTRYSFYDSLILASALRMDCKVLYSEDFNAGQKVADLKLTNPFRQ